MNSTEHTHNYKYLPAEYVRVLNTLIFRILNLFFVYPFLLTSKSVKALSGEDFFLSYPVAFYLC